MIQFINLIIFLIPILLVPVAWYIKRQQKVNVSGHRCAASWERVVAFILDLILCYLIFKSLNLSISKFSFSLSLNQEYMVAGIILWLYFSCLECSPIKATIGKVFENIQVVDLSGERIKFLQTSVRIFFTTVSIFYAGIGFITIFSTKYRQGIQDLMSNTIVVKKCYGNNLK